MMDDTPISPWLSETEWAWAQAHLPIVCVDILPVRTLPVRHDENPTVTHIGLIRRESPFGSPRWCHVGGRVNVGESLAAAARRHLTSTLGLDEEHLGATRDWDDPRRPQRLVQWFTTADRGTFGLDPRKHAVAATFALPLPVSTPIVPAEEALDFRWFAAESLPADLWPGVDLVIAAVT